jgi:hypothetical protein
MHSSGVVVRSHGFGMDTFAVGRCADALHLRNKGFDVMA